MWFGASKIRVPYVAQDNWRKERAPRLFFQCLLEGSTAQRAARSLAGLGTVPRLVREDGGGANSRSHEAFERSSSITSRCSNALMRKAKAQKPRRLRIEILELLLYIMNMMNMMN